MYKSIKNKLNNGATLVELVITIAVASILIASLSFFIGYFVSAVNKVNNFNNTTKNANDVAYQIRDYVDKLNDGNLNYNSENSYLLEYENENNVKVNINFGGSGTLKSQIENGADVKAVAKRLGHSTIRTTYEIYVKVTSKMESDVVNKFEEYAMSK